MSEQQPKTLACPRCEQQLRRVRVPIEQASAIIEVCYGGCGGLWLGPEDLAAGLTLTGSDCLLDLQVAASGPGASRWEMLELTEGEGHVKMHRYGALLRAFLTDQVAWIRDRSHVRRVTEENGRESLRMAEAATRLAEP